MGRHAEAHRKDLAAKNGCVFATPAKSGVSEANSSVRNFHAIGATPKAKAAPAGLAA
jgi:hypothetical protein